MPLRRNLFATVIAIGSILGAGASAGQFSAANAASNAPKVISTATLPAMIGAPTKVNATAAKFNVSPTKITWQWFIGTAAVKGATKSSFTTSSNNLDKKLSVQETAIFKGGKKLVAKSNLVVVGKITLSGTALLAYTDNTNTALKLTLPTLPAGATATYSWLGDGLVIDGETSDTLQIDARYASLNLTAKAKISLPQFRDSTVGSTAVSVAGPSTNGNEVLWQDNFDGAVGTSPSAADWHSVIGNGFAENLKGWGNHEREYYVADANKIVSTDTGVGGDSSALQISANKIDEGLYHCWYPDLADDDLGCRFTSGKISTAGKISFLYGHLEARVRLNSGVDPTNSAIASTNGMWPAFWTLGSDQAQHAWPNCGEIDIMETNGQQTDNLWGTLHYPGTPSYMGGITAVPGGAFKGWHTYALDWKPNHIEFSVDGIVYKIIDAQDINGLWEFNKPHYAMFNLAVGGYFVGDPKLADIAVGGNMQVDYIKYSKLDGYGTLIRSTN
jgi:beta-glucanase (GH16 family)